MSSTDIYSLINTLSNIQRVTTFVVAYIFLIFGATGCFLNVLLFSRRQFRTVSCCIYFLAASVAMFIQLGFFGATTMYSAYKENPINNISAYCKILCYLQQSISMMFRWILTAACVDRYVLTSTNACLRRFATVYIAHRVIAITVIIWLLFPIHLFIIYDTKNRICMVVYGYAAALYNGIFLIINACGIPIPIMIICTLLIRRNLANKRQRYEINIGQQQKTLNDRKHLERKRDQQVTIMLFIQIFVYIILTIPWMIYTIYDAITLGMSNRSTDRLSIERFMFFLTSTMLILFPTSSFYLYTLTSNMFRKELFNMLHSIISFKHNNNNRRIEPSTHHMMH